MRWFRSYFLVALSIVILLLLSGYFLWDTLKYTAQDLIPQILPEKAIDRKQISKRNNTFAVQKYSLVNGEVYFEIDGVLNSDVLIKERTVATTMIIDGDKDKTSIPVYFGLESSSILFSKNSNNTYNWETVKNSTLPEAMQNGSKVKLRIQLPKGTTGAEKIMADTLNGIINQSSFKNTQLVLQPQMIVAL